MIGTQDLIIIKQLPVMEEQFLALKNQIKEKLSVINGLEISEEKKSEIKKLRAEFNKDSAFYSERLKEVKNQITAPYLAIEKLFKEHISIPYAEADSYLKTAIDEIESEQKNKIYVDLVAYFNEYKNSLGLTFPSYERANFKIGVSSTLKSLKEQAKTFLNDVYEAVKSIQTLTHSDEVMVEYKLSLNLPQAIQIVEKRHERLEEAAREKEQLNMFEAQNAETITKVDEFIVPVAEEVKKEEKICDEAKILSFKVKAPVPTLKKIKQYLIQLQENGEIEII